jgi:hypothetical protein
LISLRVDRAVGLRWGNIHFVKGDFVKRVAILAIACCSLAFAGEKPDSPCNDAQFVQLNKKAIGEMNPQEVEYYMEYKEKCEDWQKDNYTAPNKKIGKGFLIGGIITAGVVYVTAMILAVALQ